MKNRVEVAYVGMCADILHKGHIRLLEAAHRSAICVVVGLLTDEAIMSYKNKPYMNYEERYEIVNSLYMVTKVVPQNTLDYTENLKALKPEAVVHADDWRTGVQKHTRECVIEVLKEWDGELLEFPYTVGVSSTMYREVILL